MTTKSSVRRILVALDASPASLAALEAAARLAVALQAELLGLYVEDESLLKGADLAITRTVGSFSGTLRPVARPEIERHLRVRAAKAKQALDAIASQARLRYSFRVTRGAVAAELLAASAEADLISLGGYGWSMIGTRRIGTTTGAVLSKTQAPVLLLRRGLRMGQSVLVVYDGKDASRRGLALAAEIAKEETVPIVVVIGATRDLADKLKDQAENDLKKLGIHRRIRYRKLQHPDAALLAAVTHGEDAALLILPTEDVSEHRFKEFLTRLECPVLIVR